MEPSSSLSSLSSVGSIDWSRGQTADSLPVTQDTFLDWATVAVAVATSCLFIAAIWAGFSARDAGRTAKRELLDGAERVKKQIDAQRTIESRRRVFDLQSRLHSQEYVEMATRLFWVIRKFDADTSAAESYWKNTMSDGQRMVVLAVLNFYELVALEYNAKILDREVANPNLAYAALVIWGRAQGLIAYLRRGDPAAFEELRVLDRDHGPAIRNAALRHTTAATPPRFTPPAGEEIHVPGPTILPLMAAVGITLIVIGATLGVEFSMLGAVLLVPVSARWTRDTHRALRNETSTSEL